MVHKRHGRQQQKFAKVVRGCRKSGKNPFSKDWAKCMKDGLTKGRRRKTHRKVHRRRGQRKIW